MNDEDVLGKAYDSRLMRRLVRYLRPYRKYVVFALALILFDAALEISLPQLARIAIDRYIAAGNVRGLGITALAYAIILVVKLATEYQQSLTLLGTGQRIM